MKRSSSQSWPDQPGPTKQRTNPAPSFGSFFRHEPLDLSKRSLSVFRILEGSGTLHLQLRHIEDIKGSQSCVIRMGKGRPPTKSSCSMEDVIRSGSIFSISLQRCVAVAGPMISGSMLSCLDQDNVLERNHQVKQMGPFYQHAKCVCIWLGKFNKRIGVLSERYRSRCRRVETAPTSPVEERMP